MSNLVLRTAIGTYGHTKALKDGTAQSSHFEMEHIDVSPVTSIFRRMVRGLEFDVAEMALSPLPYGFESARKTLETFVGFNVDQKVIPQWVNPEDMFAHTTIGLS
jgi:hypothetical protein